MNPAPSGTPAIDTRASTAAARAHPHPACSGAAANPRFDIPKLLGLYCLGQLKLDELVTRTYGLEDINQGYQDMRDGKNIRGVIIYED